jgi:hypothetical protein
MSFQILDLYLKSQVASDEYHPVSISMMDTINVVKSL